MFEKKGKYLFQIYTNFVCSNRENICEYTVYISICLWMSCTLIALHYYVFIFNSRNMKVTSKFNNYVCMFFFYALEICVIICCVTRHRFKRLCCCINVMQCYAQNNITLNCNLYNVISLKESQKLIILILVNTNNYIISYSLFRRDTNLTFLHERDM